MTDTTTNPHTGPAAAATMLGPGRCDEELPLGEVTERVLYSRFALLAPPAAEPPGDAGSATDRLRSGVLVGEARPPTVPDGTRGPSAAGRPRLALYLPFEQAWTLQGYARGRLVSTFSLAPQEDLTVEVFSWDRTVAATETEDSAETENTFETQRTHRDSTDVLRELTSSSEFSLSADLSASVSIADVFESRAELGTDLRNTAETLGRTTTQLVDEATARAGGRVRASRTTRVSSTHELGSERRVTRTLHNPNMCRTLNLDVWETLARYTVVTRPLADELRLCVLVPNPLRQAVPVFTRTELRTYDATLRRALRDRSLEAGFAAARLLDARARACAVACERCDCDAPGPSGDDPDERLVAALGDAVDAALALMTSGVDALVDHVWSNGGVFATAPVPPPQGPADAARRWSYWKVLAHQAPEVHGRLEALALTVMADVVAAARNVPSLVPLLDATTELTTQFLVARWVHTALQGPAPRLPALPPALQSVVMPVPEPERPAAKSVLDAAFDTPDLDAEDALELADVLRGRAGPGLDPASLQAVPGVTDMAGRELLAAINAEAPWGSVVLGFALQPPLADAGLATHLRRLTAVLDREGTTAERPATTRQDPVAALYPLRDVVEAMEREDALLRHLNAHRPYYWRALLRDDVWSDRLSLAGIPGIPAGAVTSRLLGLVGEDLALALEPSAIPELEHLLREAGADNAALRGVEATIDVWLPAPGVTLEPRLGSCDGCEEYITGSRAVELRLRTAEARQAELEADRRSARLAANDRAPFEEERAPVLDVRLHQDSGPVS